MRLNIGDSIQSMAVEQLLPRLDTRLDRDHLDAPLDDEHLHRPERLVAVDAGRLAAVEIRRACLLWIPSACAPGSALDETSLGYLKTHGADRLQ